MEQLDNLCFKFFLNKDSLGKVISAKKYVKERQRLLSVEKKLFLLFF